MASRFANLATKALNAARSSGTLSNSASSISRVKPGRLPKPLRIPNLPKKPSLMSRLSSLPNTSGTLGTYDHSYDYPHSGTSVSTWLLIIDIIFFLIGIILIMASQSQCQVDPNSSSCSSQKTWGIVFTTITSVMLLVILYFKFRY